MAIYNKVVSGGNGIDYTKECDNSSDYSSISNNTYFKDLSDNLIRYKTASGAIQNMFSSDPTVPQSNKIYVDSINGVNSTGRGNINIPYLTPEYALSDINNTGTVTATTTNGSKTLTAVSDTTDIVIGQFITGTGILYNSVVESKTSNTIVLSQVCTASSTITATWWTVYLLHLNGTFIATSTWLKECFYFARNPSVNVFWGAFKMWDLTTIFKTPYVNECGFNFSGTTTTSIFYHNATVIQTNDLDFTLEFQNVLSLTTGSLFVQGSSPYMGGKFKIKGKSAIAKFGYVASFGWLDIGSSNIWDIDYSYGLLGGVSMDYTNGVAQWNGCRIETPASVYAWNGGQVGAKWEFNGTRIQGSVNYFGKIFRAEVVGTTCIFTNTNIYGICPANTELKGGCHFFGQCDGYMNVTAGFNTIESAFGLGNGPVVSGSATLHINAEQSMYALQATGTSTIVINAKTTIPSAGTTITTNTIVTVNDTLKSIALSLSGTLNNYGEVLQIANPIIMNAGCVLNNYKNLTSTVSSTTIPLIQKDGGTLNLYPGSKLRVANSKPPIKCTTNTSASKDIFMFGCISNGDNATYGLFFAFDGGSYVPNNLVTTGSVLMENTIY